MTMYNSKLQLLTIFTALLILSMGCKDVFDLDQRDRTFQGPGQVAFFPNSATVADSSGAISFEVQLIGEQLEQALQIPFEVVSGETDAEAGVHYEITTPSPITLPANTSIATFTVNVLDSDITAARTLSVELQEPDGETTVAENVKGTVIRIVPN